MDSKHDELYLVFEDSRYYAAFSCRSLAATWLAFRTNTSITKPVFEIRKMTRELALGYLEPGKGVPYWDSLAQSYGQMRAATTS